MSHDCGLGGAFFVPPDDGPTPPEGPRYPETNRVNDQSSVAPANASAGVATDGPALAVSPAPASAGHPLDTLSAIYDELMRQRFAEDKDPQK